MCLGVFLRGLVPAAGEGTRLRPLTYSTPKHLIPILGRAMIEYPIGHLVEAGVSEIGVVVGYMGDMVREFLGDGSRHGARLTYILQERRLGIAHAIYRALEEGFLDREFVVYLGDNIVEGGVRRYIERFVEERHDVYILLARVADPGRFGVAVLRDGRVARLVEKPREFVSDLAVVGVYMFRDPDLVERAYRSLRPSWRGEYEITDLIQWFIDNGYSVGYSMVSGWWKDVGTHQSLLEAVYTLLDDIDPVSEGEVRGEVVGRVVVERGAVVEGRVIGPAYIGRGVRIGRDAVIEPLTSIETGSVIESGTVSRSIVLNDSLVRLGRARLVESVIGRGSRVVSNRELYGDIRLLVSDYSYVEV